MSILLWCILLDFIFCISICLLFSYVFYLILNCWLWALRVYDGDHHHTGVTVWNSHFFLLTVFIFFILKLEVSTLGLQLTIISPINWWVCESLIYVGPLQISPLLQPQRHTMIHQKQNTWYKLSTVIKTLLSLLRLLPCPNALQYLVFCVCTKTLRTNPCTFIKLDK